MRKYEERLTEPKIHTALVSVTCDICDTEGSYVSTGNVDWEPGYDVERTAVLYETGAVYPEGGYYERHSFDICPACFRDILIPLMIKHGAVIRDETVDI